MYCGELSPLSSVINNSRDEVEIDDVQHVHIVKELLIFAFCLHLFSSNCICCVLYTNSLLYLLKSRDSSVGIALG
jgi:hypothetical protein